MLFQSSEKYFFLTGTSNEKVQRAKWRILLTSPSSSICPSLASVAVKTVIFNQVCTILCFRYGFIRVEFLISHIASMTYIG